MIGKKKKLWKAYIGQFGETDVTEEDGVDFGKVKEDEANELRGH